MVVLPYLLLLLLLFNYVCLWLHGDDLLEEHNVIDAIFNFLKMPPHFSISDSTTQSYR